MDNVLKGCQIMDAATQYAWLKACFAVQGDKAGPYRPFGAEAFFNNANTGVGNDPYA